MQYYLNTESKYYKAMVEAGFTMDSFEVQTGDIYSYCLHAIFTCVCGKKEYLVGHFSGNEYFLTYPKAVDVARILYQETQSFSVEHLRKDGYCETDIAKIRESFMRLEAL